MSTNGQLVFTDVDKITFKGVGNTSNAVVDTVTGKIGVGIDSPDANLHVLGNSYVSTNLELGGTLIMGTVNVESQHSLEAITATGNTTPVTVEFQNADTSLVASGNVEVGTANLFVDTASSKIGVGTVRPSKTLVVGGDVAFPQSVTSTDSHNTTDRALYIGGKDYNGSLTQAKCAIISSPLAANGGLEQYGRNSLHFCVGPDSQDDVNASVSNSQLSIDRSGNVGIGITKATQRFHVHQNLPTTSHHVMARIGGDTSSYNTLVFGSKEGRPHIGGHRGDFGTWADLSLQDDKLIISQGGIINANGTLQIQGFNAKRVLIGYQRFTTTSSSHSSGSHSSWVDRWTVNYTRKHASSRIYATGFIAVGQALGGTNNVSYRETYARFKVTQNNGSVSNGDSVRGWSRVDNSFHEYQRHVRIDVTEGVFNGTGANQNLTFTVQTYAGAGTGNQGATGINIWTGRSFIEVYETMVA
tara:strand:+ start:2303 stop:3715 length:1413 start_codon:yes stop_codon:yes gene_type:complete